MEQILVDKDGLVKCQQVLEEQGCLKTFIVCGNSVSKHPLVEKFLRNISGKVMFQEFKPNPDYESIMSGLEKFKENNCDSIVAIGGGSAIDVAKCIKAFLVENGLDMEGLLLMVIPTTAGSGSEATKFAVMYRDGEKQSIEREWIRPNWVFFESRLLESLPLSQKKATVLDALCHSIEAYWAVNADENSRRYATLAIETLLNNYKLYFENDREACAKMHMASYYAGLAINISRTTAGHALCYKLTTLYGIPHGQAAALCLNQVWRHTISLAREQNNNNLLQLLKELAVLLKGKTIDDGPKMFVTILNEMEIDIWINGSSLDIEHMVNSVNLQRLHNHPVRVSKEIIEKIYFDILKLE